MLKPVKIKSKMNEQAITVSEGQFKTKQDHLIVTKYYNGVKQQFYLLPTNQDFMIRMIDVKGGSASIYSKIITYKQHGDHNQIWRLRNYKEEPNTYYIENKKSKLVLEIEGGINEEGMTIVQNKFYGNLNQLWSFQQI